MDKKGNIQLGFTYVIHTISQVSTCDYHKKRIMLLDALGAIVLLLRNSVCNPHRLTSDANDHTYSVYRRVKIDVNISKFIDIE